jgi:hypothetical protein
VADGRTGQGSDAVARFACASGRHGGHGDWHSLVVPTGVGWEAMRASAATPGSAEQMTVVPASRRAEAVFEVGWGLPHLAGAR